MSIAKCLKAITIGLVTAASTQLAIHLSPGRWQSLPIQVAFLSQSLTFAYAEQVVAGPNWATPPSDIQHQVDETEDDILKRLTDESVTGSNESTNCLPLSAPLYSTVIEKVVHGKEEEIDALSDELFVSTPVTGYQITTSSKPKPVSDRAQKQQKAHISTTLKKLTWLTKIIFPYRLVGICLGLTRDVIKFGFLAVWRLVCGCAMVLGHLLLFVWEDIIFPLLFPVRLLLYIFVVFPYKLASRIYRALKPLFVFLASAITVGILMGLVGGMGNAILGDWIISSHKTRTGSRAPPKSSAAFSSPIEDRLHPSSSGRHRRLEDVEDPISIAQPSSLYSGLHQANGSVTCDRSITTATKLNNNVVRQRSSPSTRKQYGDPSGSGVPDAKVVYSNRDGLSEQPIIPARERSHSGSSTASKTSSILKGSRKKAGASSLAGRSESSISGTSSKGKKKKVTFKSD
ncbi:hypothetical protein CROQUDRAFT_670948 [Cronartium quercuum f. sp. fusiforme G11]|uniref:Uncharacterized protein n=1 Tax=Cronartium quercuum f. sp. fusiforme G11 TaxID=708437 RepID=A0A9P6TDI1_9BASI|nr:hypothetical protein CROQUDRAFT_670948 [Cronartium quercuum f. sp. fusiforme G11]